MAIELPNGKISRTLPEQVGFNSKKIYEIIKWINDSGFIDKVLNLSDPSGTLTESQYAIVDLSPSYIVYGGKVFVKSLEDSDNIDFFKVGTDMSESDSIIASAERVRVVKATKAYQYSVVQLFESYNKTQLDNLLAEKADLSGAEFTGAVKAPTLEQTTANWSTDFEFTPAQVGNASLIVENKYCRLEVINNVLYLVAVVKYTNPTESMIAISTSIKDIVIPEEIGKRIVDFNGIALDQYSVADISADCMYTGESGHTSLNLRNLSIRHYENNKIRLVFILPTSLNAGAYEVFTFRTFLTLI